ncbi:glutamate racemase [Desulfoluna spongiiphila]|uniref:Glutamate racemase n=1 Tax=Desulfoluna spongiiphila TaxID=419481 RepID=A0A1G5BXS0_9BACT|nr:glutamate racemase [Desulfoluna spongiiphila]SCX94913.1 glutamate racemase [Desulfoluna spongiiphila]VVS93974.1 glutamate racemase [Desulfoluna spongiiphila]
MIGIFDSGIGGLTTCRALKQLLPGHEMIYFGDTARTPYGSKSRETVVRYSLENTRFLLDMGAEMIVVGCNTASSVAPAAIREAFDVPVFEVVTPAVEQALAASKKGQIGVIGTRGTIASRVYETRIKEMRPTASVHSNPCPLLVPLVEEGWFDRPETRRIVKSYIHPLRVRQIDTLILGCTHYPMLEPIIKQKAGKRVSIINSGAAVARQVKAYVDAHPEWRDKGGSEGCDRFYVSDYTPQFRSIAESILNQKVELQLVQQ